MENYTAEQRWYKDEITEERWLMAIQSGRVEPCQTVVAEGCDVNFRMRSGGRPLITAAAQGALDVCRFLLDNGAHVNQGDDAKKTALHFAAANSKVEVCRLLLARGADIHAKNDQEATPLHWAAASGGADMTKVLLAAGGDVAALSNGGATPLHEAVEGKHLDVVEILLAAGADPMFRPEDYGASYLTPFELAINLGNADAARTFHKTTVDPYAPTAGGIPLMDIASKKAPMQDFIRALKLEWDVRHAVDSAADAASPPEARQSKADSFSPL